MKAQSFNENWLFSKPGGEPRQVTLPHDAMIHETRDQVAPLSVLISLGNPMALNACRQWSITFLKLLLYAEKQKEILNRYRYKHVYILIF